MEDTQKRVVPYFTQRIMGHIKQGDNVLVAAHGNSLRAIIMVLDDLKAEDVPTLELATGVPIVYDFDDDGNVVKKIILAN